MVVALHPVEAFLELAHMSPNVDGQFGIHDSMNLALDMRDVQCVIAFQAAKLVFKISNVIPNVASS